MSHENLTITLTRTVAKRAQLDVATRLLTKAVYAAIKREPYRCRSVKVNNRDGGYFATVELYGRTGAVLDLFKEKLREILIERFTPPWLFSDATDGAHLPPVEADAPAKVEDKPVGKVDLSFDPAKTFERVYGREAQIRRVLDALTLGVSTNWNKRKHTLLSGPPGCGKTELMLTLAKALGNEGEAWLWYDATSTTKAGAIEQIITAKSLPPILFVEEIEKTQESALRWLLGMMDERGEIRRTNYRVGNQHKAVRMSVIATANNTEILRAMDAGALYSRFSNRISCPPPDREVMGKILHREVESVAQFNNQWVDATLEFGFDRLRIRDPRELINILLCGRDRLLTGEYQHDYAATMPYEDAERWGCETAIEEEKELTEVNSSSILPLTTRKDN